LSVFPDAAAYLNEAAGFLLVGDEFY